MRVVPVEGRPEYLLQHLDDISNAGLVLPGPAAPPGNTTIGWDWLTPTVYRLSLPSQTQN